MVKRARLSSFGYSNRISYLGHHCDANRPRSLFDFTIPAAILASSLSLCKICFTIGSGT